MRALALVLSLLLPAAAWGQGVVRSGRSGSTSTSSASSMVVYPFDTASTTALMPEDRGTVTEHVYWDGVQLVSTKGTAYTMLGTVPQSTSGQLLGARGMAGAYSAANRYRTTNNADPFDFTGSGLTIVQYIPNSATTGRLINGFTAAASGWSSYSTGAGALYGPFSGGGGALTPGTNNGATLGSLTTACLGQSGAVGFINLNQNWQRYQPATSALTGATGSPTYFGVNYDGTGNPLDGSLVEILALSPVATSQEADALCTYYTNRMFGVSGFQSLRATDGTYVVGGTRYTAPVNRPRITANGIVLDPPAINYFAIPLTPATQTMTARAVTEPIYCWLEGSGSIALTAGTFSGTGLPCTVTSSSACLLSSTGGGTITATVSGTVTAANCTNTSAPTQLVKTSGTYPANVMGGDIIRVPNSGNGATAGSGSIEVYPNWAASAAGVDRPVLVDSSLGVPAGTTPGIKLSFVAATRVWRLAVGGVTVNSAAQSFSAGSRVNLAWTYTVGGQACLTVNSVQSCGGTVSTFTPGAFLTLGTLANPTDVAVTFMGMGAAPDVGFAGAAQDLVLGPTANAGAKSTAVACLGDSLTYSKTAAVANPYPYALQVALGAGWTVDNHGVSGQSLYVDTQSGSVHSRYWRDIQGMPYSTIVVMAGTNDVIANKTAVATEPWLQSIFDSVRADGKRLVPVTIPPSSTFTAGQKSERTALNAWILSYCSANGVTCVDAGAAMDDGSGNLSTTACSGGTCDGGDHLHLSQAGYNVIATMVAAAIPH